MHRINTSGRVVDKHGSGKDGFTEGDPANGTPPTEVSDDWLDAVQEEIANAVTLTGETIKTVETDTFTQLFQAISRNALRPLIAHLLSDFEELDVQTTGIQMLGVATHTHDSGVNHGLVQVVVGGFDGEMAYSEDGGDAWALATHLPTGTIRKVVYGDGRFYVIYDTTTGAVDGVSSAPTSALGTFAAVATTIGSINLYGGVWSGTLAALVVVGAGGAIYTGTTAAYTSRTSGTSQDLRAVAADSNGVVCAAGGTTITRSDDGGATWAVVSTAGTTFRDIYYDESTSIWFAIQTSGSLFYSIDDGLTWMATSAFNGYGVVAVAGALISYYAAAGEGSQIRWNFSPGNVLWRTPAGEEMTADHLIHFDREQGQFWVITSVNDAVYRSKRAPSAFVPALTSGVS